MPSPVMPAGKDVPGKDPPRNDLPGKDLPRKDGTSDVTTTSPTLPAGAYTAPALTIAIDAAEPVDLAAVPTLRFRAAIRAADGRLVRSIALHAQIRIAAHRRSYDRSSRDRLVELFGTPDQWGRSLRSLLWTQATVTVPEFDGETVADIPVTCTYDFDVVATKYLHALAEADGEVPLEFLFSGTVFYVAGGALQAARIPWNTEAAYRMPVRVWTDLMARYFPGSAWLRLDLATFDRLHDFKARNTLPSWESAIDALLRAAQRHPGGG
jgi:hypothetical protein